MLTALTILSLIDLGFVTVAVNLNWTTNFYVYPWIASMFRPVIFVYNMINVRRFWERYIVVIKGSIPMTILLFIFVMFFAWTG